MSAMIRHNRLKDEMDVSMDSESSGKMPFQYSSKTENHSLDL